MILVTGGAGFIGSYFINQWIKTYTEPVTCFDKLTYAADLGRLTKCPSLAFVKGDICDRAALHNVFLGSTAVFHFAAETHVTRSIADPTEFVRTNVQGTYCVLEEALSYWRTLTPILKKAFRFVHISTDEVFGSLVDKPFTESSPYLPSTPYAASKAASDHLVRAFHVTYGLPTITVHPTNNYGPGQHEEKLIPLVVKNALEGNPITIHGDGRGTRDWIHVEDNCSAIRLAARLGKPGESYVIGARNERRVIDVVYSICATLDEIRPKPNSYVDQIVHVPDRPGNDRRYSVNPDKIEALGWEPEFGFSLRETVHWFAQERMAA